MKTLIKIISAYLGVLIVGAYVITALFNAEMSNWANPLLAVGFLLILLSYAIIIFDHIYAPQPLK